MGNPRICCKILFFHQNDCVGYHRTRNHIPSGKDMLINLVYSSLLKTMAHPRGFEPLTFASGGQRSIQLSYGCLVQNYLFIYFKMTDKPIEMNNNTVERSNRMSLTERIPETLSCSGDSHGALEHPKVYLTFKTDVLTCPYCSKVFQRELPNCTEKTSSKTKE